MAIALLSVGLLGLLVFILGLNVSMKRSSVVMTQGEAEADPGSELSRARRAHGNCVEYTPMLCFMILAIGLRMPILPWWVAAGMLAAVAFRYIHAVSILISDSIYQTTPLKFIGALGTYIVGVGLSLFLIFRAFSLF